MSIGSKTYRVISLKTGETWDIGGAHLVARFLFIQGFGKQSGFAVFKNGRRYPLRASGSEGEYAEALRRWKPKKAELT
jgi:hypothetical protein